MGIAAEIVARVFPAGHPAARIFAIRLGSDFAVTTLEPISPVDLPRVFSKWPPGRPKSSTGIDRSAT